MNSDGTGLVNITQTPEADESVFVWSPDSTGLLYVSDASSNPEIYWVKRDGSVRDNLTQHPAPDVAPIWVYVP